MANAELAPRHVHRPAPGIVGPIVRHAIELSGWTGNELRSLAKRADRPSPGDKHLIPPYRLGATAQDEANLNAASRFLEAARYLRRLHYFDIASRCFFFANHFARCADKPQARAVELSTYTERAETHLTAAEIARAKDISSHHYSTAADEFLRAAWYREDADELEAARREYANAGHYYWWADEFQRASWAYQDDARIAECLDDHESAGSSYGIAADYLLEHAHAHDDETSISIASSLKGKAAESYARLDSPESKKRAMGLFSESGELALSRERGSQRAVDAYRRAYELAKLLRDHESYDRLRFDYHSAKQALVRVKRQKLQLALLAASDFLWGFGSKPQRLARAWGISWLVFSILFYVAAPSSGVTFVSAARRALWSAGLSMLCLTPVPILNWAGWGKLTERLVPPGFLTALCRAEIAIGLLLAALAAIALRERMSRLAEK